MSYLSSIKLPNNEIYDLRDSRINFDTTDDKFLNHDGTWTSITPEIEDAFGYKSGAGSVVSFNDGAQVPLFYLNIDFSAKQNGTPWVAPSVNTEPYLLRQSPDLNHGYNSEIDTLVGGSIAWNQLAEELNSTNYYINDYAKLSSYSYQNNVLTMVIGTATDWIGPLSVARPVIAGHKYYVKADITSPKAVRYSANSGSVLSNYSIAGVKTECSLIETAAVAACRAYLKCVEAGLVNGDTIRFENFEYIDLTAFNSDIADYVYSLEQGTAGSGVAWLKEHFPKLFDEYHAYDTGSLVSVKTSEHRTTGFNQWDEEWEVGSINGNTGDSVPSSIYIRSKNKTRVVPNATYYFNRPSGNKLWIYGYDANKNFVYLDPASHYKVLQGNVYEYTIPSNVYYIRFIPDDAYGTTYNHDICINISKTTGTPKNGDYVAYDGHSYSLDSDLELRGIPKLSNGSLYYDGDEYPPSGQVVRKYVRLTAEQIIANYDSYDATTNLYRSFIYAPELLSVTAYSSTTIHNPSSAMSNLGECRASWVEMQAFDHANEIGVYRYPTWDYTRIYISIADTSVTTKAQAETWITNHISEIQYKLATPTTETADSFTSPQIVSPYGTEEYVDTRSVPVPVGHRTSYADIYPISGLSEAKVYVNSTNTTSGAKIYTLNLNGTRYGGTIDFLHGVLTLTYGYVDLGTQNWIYESTSGHERLRCEALASVVKPPVSNQDKANVICSAYDTITASESYSHVSGAGISVGTTGFIYVYDANYTNASTFKTAMNGVQFVYELAEPQTIQLTPTQVMALQGTNYIWSNGDNINLRYTSDSALYLEAMEQYAAYVANETVKKYGMIEVTKTGVSSLPITITDSNIRANDKVINSTFSNPSVKITNWNVTTIDGSLTISGTIDGTTDITLDLVPKVN